ncbi:MAG: AI-2E family transporter [Solirubrobacterales bacterium]|nr:AI-2E family transporter [Solirubrobacterales bacterium]
MAFRFYRRPGGAEPGTRDDPLDSARADPLDSARDGPLDSAGGDPLDSAGDDPLDSHRDDPLDSPTDNPLESARGGGPAGSGSATPPTAAPLTQPGVPVAPVVVPRWVQLVILPLALLALWALARAAGTVVLILLAASTIALILNPLVRMLVRRGVPRGLSIFLLYLAVFAVVGGLGVVLANPISTQVSHFERDVPHFIDTANRDLASLQRWLDRHGIHVQIQQQGQTALQTLQHNILKRSSAIVSFSRDLLTQIVTTSFDLVLIFVLSIYLLVYGDEIGRLVRRMMPPGDGTPEDDYPLLVQRAVFGYVRGQFLFSLIMGASAMVALWTFGVLGIFPDGERYAIFFGAFYGLMEFIPYIGPIIGPLPAVLVALFVNPISAVWVILLFVGLQQLEGHLVAPQVFRISLRINPILVILALLIGYQLYGIVGALLALPVAAVIRQTVLYLRRHLVLEPWGTLGSGLISSAGTERCAECGAAAGPRDAYCRSCGASLESRVRMPG